FINAPGVIGGFEVRPASFLQFGGIALDPAIDRRVIDVQTPFPHHFLEISVTKRVPQIPANAQEKNLGLKMTPFEGVLLVHGCCSPRLSRSNQAYSTRSPHFLQQNR